VSGKPRKRVFIPCGGAALGGHQVGAMRLLEEAGVTPDAIVGSSLGVIHASPYASGGVENMEKAWLALAEGGSFFPAEPAPQPLHRALARLDRAAGGADRAAFRHEVA